MHLHTNTHVCILIHICMHLHTHPYITDTKMLSRRILHTAFSTSSRKVRELTRVMRANIANGGDHSVLGLFHVERTIIQTLSYFKNFQYNKKMILGCFYTLYPRKEKNQNCVWNNPARLRANANWKRAFDHIAMQTKCVLCSSEVKLVQIRNGANVI